MNLPGYDAWKTMSPDDENPCCEFCGVSDRAAAKGWHPDCCTGECRKSWRDPDAEYEAMRGDG
jgi:hypothetical protein